MEHSFNTLAFFFISILSISSATQTIEPDCGPCTKPHPSTPKTPIITLPPIVTVPPVVTVPKLPIPPVGGGVPIVPIPPVTVPKVPVPPVTVPIPPVTVPTVPIPPVTVPIPPVTVPKVPVPPVTVTIPPVTVPNLPLLPPVTVPIVNPPAITNPPKEKPCKPARPAKKATCPIDTLKLGACGALLGGLVHVGLGDPAVHKCCPVLEGLAEVEAAACLCTTLKINGLNLNVYVPIALQLLVTCGKTPPPGYTCSI